MAKILTVVLGRAEKSLLRGCKWWLKAQGNDADSVGRGRGARGEEPWPSLTPWDQAAWDRASRPSDGDLLPLGPW